MATKRPPKPITVTARPKGGYQVAGSKLTGRPATGYEVAGKLPAAKSLVPWIKQPPLSFSGSTQV